MTRKIDACHVKDSQRENIVKPVSGVTMGILQMAESVNVSFIIVVITVAGSSERRNYYIAVFIVACECNGQAETCHPETGRCFCTTKGIVGEHCDRCDTQNNYLGDPTNGGSCFCECNLL